MPAVELVLGMLPKLLSCLCREIEPHRTIIRELEQKFNDLTNLRARLRLRKGAMNEQISNAEARGLIPTAILTGWLEQVVAMESRIAGILGPEDNLIPLPEKCLGCCYPKLLSAYDLGQEIAVTLPEASALLQNEPLVESAGMFNRAPLDHLPEDQTFGIDTSRVWRYLDDPRPQIIKICGMGGIGKTALMEKTHNEFHTRVLVFDIIIFVDATNSSDVNSIQLAVNEKLGLDWSGITREHARAKSINNFLKKKSFVLFIDDPHRDLTLKKVGIPVHDNLKNCKVIFSTKDQNVSLGLGGNEYHEIEVDLLRWEDAWNLFQQAVGDVALPASGPLSIKNVAENVARLCGGLPLTLVTVGRAMSRKKELKDWELAEEKLKNFDASIGRMDEAVYKRFHVSYDGLSTAAQSCFLYCSLFPRHYLVRKDAFLDYWMGENFLKNDVPALSTIQSIRNHGYNIIGELNDAYLLEKSEDEDILRMHDTVRGYALWVARSCGEREGAVWADSWVRLPQLSADHLDWENVQRISLVQSDISNLNRITCRCSSLSTLILRDTKVKEISEGFFQAMSSLKVLDLSGCTISTFPSEITLLSELQYLNMSRTHITKLSNDLKKLTKLKFLDLSFIPELQQIPPGMMINLKNLLVLNMYSSGYQEQHRKSGSVLPFDLSARSFRLLRGDAGQTLFQELESLIHLQDLGISVNGSEALRSLLKSTKLGSIQRLFITKCQDSQLSFSKMVNLRVLRVFDCPQLVDLQMINCFENLRQVEVDSCWSLSDLTWLKYASNLQSLKVVNCIKVTAIISGSGSSAGAGSEQNHLLFSCLKSISLNNLPELKMICENTLPFALLEEIEVHSCPNLNELPLDISSVSKSKTLKYIKGHDNWWRNIQWTQQEGVEEFTNTYFKFQTE